VRRRSRILRAFRRFCGGAAIGVDGAAGRITTQPDALGDSGGNQTHQLTACEMPQHFHELDVTDAATTGASAPIPDYAGGGTGVLNTRNAGGNGNHNNLQPHVVVNWFIRR
jgi:microcystin-dependent protein